MNTPTAATPNSLRRPFARQRSHTKGRPVFQGGLGDRRACINCEQIHIRSQDESPENCFLITIRRSRRDRLRLSATQNIAVYMRQFNSSSNERTTHLHQTPLDHYAIRDSIWTEFESLKAENDDDRQNLSRSPDFKRRKGQLMEKLPIPWLAWSSPTGQHGQTRHKGNFFALWDRIVAEYSRTSEHDTMFVSSLLLPSAWDTQPFQQNTTTSVAHCLDAYQAMAELQTQRDSHDPGSRKTAYESGENHYLEDSETASDSSYENMIDRVHGVQDQPLTWRLPTRLK
jgi:hypothetical protein